MLLANEPTAGRGDGAASMRSEIVVAGPSSSLTIPGLIVSQIVMLLASGHEVTHIEVDQSNDFDAGLHRAPSLAAAHDELLMGNVVSYQAPLNPRLRTHAFRKWIGADTRTAIAFVWPGLDNNWVKQFIAAAQNVGATATVVCVSLPKSSHSKVIAMADVMSEANLILVGNPAEADALHGDYGKSGPVVETHRALSLHGRSVRPATHQITAFLPKDSTETLATLLTAFDAIPEAWIENYQLQVVMRYSKVEVPNLVANSYHADSVHLIGDDISSQALKDLISASSALITADPAFDSRVFSMAVDCGVATVVLASMKLPDVGHRYVGALLADVTRPVSIHVALSHALRLAELQFPTPDSWNDLVHRLIGSPANRVELTDVREPATYLG